MAVVDFIDTVYFDETVYKLLLPSGNPETLGEGLQAFCIPGSVAHERKVGLGHGNLASMLLRDETKCFAFVFGTKYQGSYNYFYIASIVVGATASLSIVINLIDGVYALMSIPTMISAILLAPKVRKASILYFDKLKGHKSA